jgi:addiction module HigA family antidote
MVLNNMRPIHPGEMLREDFLIPLGMSAHALAMAIHVPVQRINDIVREKRSLSPDSDLRLSRYFGTTPEFWMNLQSAFDLRTAQIGKMADIERVVRPRDRAA